MATKRTLLAAALGAVTAAVQRTGLAQSAGGPQTGQGGQAGLSGGRGAPTGRTGAATRGAAGAEGHLALDLAAPLRGAGLASTQQPILFYILSGRTAQPARLTISTHGQAQPLANVLLPRAQGPGLAAIRLRDHNVKLLPNLLCVWSVTLPLDPGAPSRDLVATALVQHRPSDPALDAASREVALERRVAALAHAGFWYDAVALAEQSRGGDGGATLAWLFEREALRLPGDARPAAAASTR